MEQACLHQTQKAMDMFLCGFHTVKGILKSITANTTLVVSIL